MNRRTWMWLVAAVAVALLVAYQAVRFADVLRGYSLPIDQASGAELRQATSTCPTD